MIRMIWYYDDGGVPTEYANVTENGYWYYLHIIANCWAYILKPIFGFLFVTCKIN